MATDARQLVTDPATGLLVMEGDEQEAVEAFEAMDATEGEEQTGYDPTRSVAAQRAEANAKKGKPGAPKRSWSIKDKSGFTGRFKFEGATIYVNLLTEQEWDALEAHEDEMREISKSIQEEGEAIDANRKLPEGDELRLSDEEHDERLKAYRKRANKVAVDSLEFQRNLLRDTIVSWSGAPLPYSKEAIEDLPAELVAEWATVILEKSRLGKSESDVLRRS